MYGGGGSNLAIGIALTLRDQFSGRANAAAASLDNLDRKASQAARRQMESQRQLNAVGAGIGLMAIRGMSQWVKVGAEFDYTMNYVNAIAEKKGGIGFDKLSQKAKTLGADTMFTARQVADGMKYMAMAGQSTEDIFKNINASVALAGATMSRVEGKGGAADILTNLMRGFGISGTEENSMRVADILTTSATSANTSLWDLHEAMKYSMSTAKSLGLTMEETGAMIMMAGDSGIQGSMAGTATENALRYVTRAADESRKGRAGKALRQIGLAPEDLQDAKGNLLAISPLLKVIKGGIKGLGQVKAYNFMSDIFGVRGNREAMLLLENLGDFDNYIDKLSNHSGGSALKVLGSQMETLQGHFLQLGSAWESFKITFTENLAPALLPITKGVTWLVKALIKVMGTPFGKWLTMGAAAFIVIKTAAMAYKAVVLSLKLAQMSMGQTFAGTSSSIVGGYGKMTAAATKYAAASRTASYTTAQVQKFGGGAGYTILGKNKNGSFRTRGPGGGIRHVSATDAAAIQAMQNRGKGVKGASTMGKAANFAGRAAPWAMAGGLGMQMAGQYAGDNAWGKGLTIGGDALGWAGTGAMVGSMVGPVGTAVGGIVGGVGSLLWSLYDELEEEADKVEAAKDGKKGTPSSEEWIMQARKMNSMYEGNTIYGKGFREDQLYATDRSGAYEYMGNGGTNINGNVTPNRIIIRVDGKDAMDELIQEKEYETLIKLSGF